ncbi:amino acid carrier protein [Chlamydiifrater volucris]|uniref:amino acid carrier protein n=1 Tax=Chlamydiifrater volucris TaxID=2681470 RepID=UPI0032B1EEDF
MGRFLAFLQSFDDFFWSYVAFAIIMTVGVCFSLKSKFSQITHFPELCREFFSAFKQRSSQDKKGVHPIKVFFASTGGNIGIGNVVGIVTAACIGGPGAMLWVWIAGILGSIVKYAEVYLGVKFRVLGKDGVFYGGPMYFLERAYRTPLIPIIVAVLLCIYGVEIYQFSVIADSVSHCWSVPRLITIASLLFAVIYAVLGGLQRIGKICSLVLPFFMVVYCFMGVSILVLEASKLPELLKAIFHSAFTGHAAIAGFAGSSLATTIHQGISRAAYSGDIGIGFDSVIQSESSADRPETQAKLSIVGMAVDNFICTISLLMVLASGSWLLGLENASLTVEKTLSTYFPFVKVFLPLFLFVTGYTTITSYFLVGSKCAAFLYPKHGKKLYLAYGTIALPLFCFLSQNTALLVMSVSGALLLCFNLLGVFLLRQEVRFPGKVQLQETQLEPSTD